MTDTLVLLPGTMCDARLFQAQIVGLSSDRSVLIGYLGGADTVEEIAREVIAGAPERFALAGLGLGGIVALEVLRRAPDRVARVALMDTTCLPETPATAAAREEYIVGARAGRLEEIVRDELKPDYLAPGPKRLEVLQAATEMARALGPEVYVRQARALQRRPDQQATLRKAKLPALVACGAHDGLFPVKRHEFMAELMPNARLEIIPEAGHLPPLERPETVTGLLHRWLRAADGLVLAE